MTENDRQTRGWRLLSLETLLALAGVALLATGLFLGRAIGIFWGGVTLCGLFLLQLIRRKDWQKHWDEKNRHVPAKKNER